MTAISEAVTTGSADSLLRRTAGELDLLFLHATPGPTPDGTTRGTAIVFPGRPAARVIARVSRLLFWKGKVFNAATHDLRNLVSPLGVPAIRALVYDGDSWLDQRPCTVIDYSRTSKLAGWIRDEIREVSPGLHLGLVWGVGRLFGGRRLIARFALTVPSRG